MDVRMVARLSPVRHSASMGCSVKSFLPNGVLQFEEKKGGTSDPKEWKSKRSRKKDRFSSLAESTERCLPHSHRCTQVVIQNISHCVTHTHTHTHTRRMRIVEWLRRKYDINDYSARDDKMIQMRAHMRRAHAFL